MDAFLEGECNIFNSGNVETTPNIVFQQNRFEIGEPLANKFICEKALFASSEFLDNIRNLYKANIDIPILVSGFAGCGKITAILGMMPSCLAYYPGFNDRDDKHIINNLSYFKILDENQFPKIFFNENLFFCNIALLMGNNEIMNYLEHIYKIARSRSIDGSRKIFIISHIECCNYEQQRYITFMLDKINSTTSYILTTTNSNKIIKKIRTFCVNIHYKYPNENKFTNVFKINFNALFEKKFFTINYMKKFWEIYRNNKWNIGRSIAQIKYLLSCNDISLEKLKLNENNNSMIENIATNFIKKKMKLGMLESTMEIRKFLYNLVSINIDVIEFVQCLIRQLLSRRINLITKHKIIEKAGEFSFYLPRINKELITLETFLYELIYIIYSGGQTI